MAMPTKPRKPCNHPGCPNLTDKKYCEKHTDDRPSAAERGYDGRWRKARARFLKVHPFCVNCKSERKIVKATVVDHIVPHRGDECRNCFGMRVTGRLFVRGVMIGRRD